MAVESAQPDLLQIRLYFLPAAASDGATHKAAGGVAGYSTFLITSLANKDPLRGRDFGQ